MVRHRANQYQEHPHRRLLIEPSGAHDHRLLDVSNEDDRRHLYGVGRFGHGLVVDLVEYRSSSGNRPDHRLLDVSNEDDRRHLYGVGPMIPTRYFV